MLTRYELSTRQIVDQDYTTSNGEHVQTSYEFSKSTQGHLTDWLRTDGGVAAYLTPPKKLFMMSEDARKETKHEEKINAAKKIVGSNLHKNEVFTRIIEMVVDLKRHDAGERCCRFLQDCVGEIQASHDAAYVGSKRNKKPAVV